MKLDLGTVLTLSGTGITTSYQASSVVNGGRADTFRMSLVSTTVGGTSITSVMAKIQASADGTTYSDVYSQESDLTNLVEHTFAIAAAGTAQMDSLTVPGDYKYLKVLVKAVGGAGTTNESVVVKAQAV